MNTDTKKNYRTLTKCDSGKLYKVIEYDSGARVEIPVNQDGSVKWLDDSKLLKKYIAEVQTGWRQFIYNIQACTGWRLYEPEPVERRV